MHVCQDGWVIPFSVYFFQYDMLAVIRYYLFGISPGQLWFLLMMFGVFVCFYPLSNFMARNDVGGAAVTLLIYVVGLAGGRLLPNVFQIFRACTYFPLFWLGFKIRQYGSLMLRKIPVWLWLLADAVLFAVVTYLSRLDGVIFALLRFGFEFLLHIVGALMAFVILQKIADRVKWKNSRIFTYFSKNSMPVYLFHQQVVYVLLYWLNGLLNPYVHSAVNFIGAMAISLLLSALMMRFRVTKMLVGEK